MAVLEQTSDAQESRAPNTGSAWPWRVLCFLILGAFVFSAVLWLDESRGSDGICGFGGCAEVRASRFSHLAGIPLSALGTALFGALLLLALFPERKAGSLLRPLVIAAGAVGLGLIGLQVLVIRQICPWCMAVDGTAIAAALVAAVGLRQGPYSAPRNGERTLWLSAAGTALLLPFGLFPAGAAEAPPQVRQLWKADAINVVEIVDFACPHCRDLHRRMNEELSQRKLTVHLVLVSASVPQHRGSRGAALAYRAVEALGHGPAFADALFKSAELSPPTCERLAESVGVPLAAYREQLANPQLVRRLDADLEWMHAATPKGLPAVWVQDRLLVGQKAVDEIGPALQLAANTEPK